VHKNITTLLNLSYEKFTEEELYQAVYSELKKMARRQLNKFGHKAPLDTTELVHETYLKLQNKEHWNNRAHFYGVAAIAMRHILVNLAKMEKTKKRDIAPEELLLLLNNTSKDIYTNVLSIDKALQELELINPRAVRIIEFKIFVGLKADEISEILDTSVATIKRDWSFAKTWLYQFLKDAYDHQ